MKVTGKSGVPRNIPVVGYFDDYLHPAELGDLKATQQDMLELLGFLTGQNFQPKKTEHGQMLKFLGLNFDWKIAGQITLSLGEGRRARLLNSIETHLADDELRPEDAAVWRENWPSASRCTSIRLGARFSTRSTGASITDATPPS